MTRQMEGHTVLRYDGELGHLHMLVLQMGALAMNQVHNALDSLEQEDLSVAHAVVAREHEVDALEVQTDNEIINVVARRAPVARDLRFVMSISKMVMDFERIADEAARIANVTLQMYDNSSSKPGAQLLRDVSVMGKLAMNLLREAIQVFDQMDAQHAEAVIRNHRELDAEFRSSIRRLATFVLEDARNVGHTINVVLIIKALERVGDHAKNIAEYVVYLLKGTDVRHVDNGAVEAHGGA